MNTPKISVLILTYNRAHLLERSISSVLNQTFRDFEIVLVDNGSTDGTPEILKKYKEYKNIRIFSIEKNHGFAKGYNFCLDQIRGEWFGVVGDDDEIKPNALVELFNVLETVDPELTAINCNGLDSATGTYSGLGLHKDQYLSLETVVRKCDGDFWGVTKTSLIKDKRLNTNIPGMENTFWYKVDAIAKRYYIHQQLITYYTDHGSRETDSQTDDLGKKALLYRTLLEEPFFWEVLKKHNKKQYRDRCIKAMHFLKAAKDFKNYKVYQKMLAEDHPGLRYKIHSGLIGTLNPEMLKILYLLKGKIA